MEGNVGQSDLKEVPSFDFDLSEEIPIKILQKFKPADFLFYFLFFTM